MEDIRYFQLGDFVERWLTEEKEMDVKPSTYDRLKTSLIALREFRFSAIPICDITPGDNRNYIRQLINRGYGYSTIKKQMQIVAAPMRYAADKGYIEFNPCAGIKVPSKTRVTKTSKEIIAYTPSEQDALIRIFKERHYRGCEALWFMMETGLRVGECLALRWCDVNTRTRKLAVRATVVNLAHDRISYIQKDAKSKSSNRVIPLSIRAIDILNRIGEGRTDEGFIFLGNNGQRLTYEALRYQCQKACDLAGVDYHGLHVFRHTFATNLYYKGIDVKILSKLLGHADTGITYNIYIHLYGSGFDEMLSAVD